ncbi:MAG: nicotinate phosphoribosyltransferase [Sulfolobales archaeon]|nr:nicotinate phosphoribosyltransferase [Sulfolobales archaeon]MCX8209268.1 nicotinate phosphoribosyltransferase [Sulfolobales archaeon]MDW8011099.1 nicotinate phosphoribosyltransferase [Sulfolobales archaeon]
MGKPRLYVASEEEITSGAITDVYFARTKKILEAKGLDRVRVRMEVHISDLPKGYEWAVYAGLEEALKILEGKPLDVYSIPEGTLVKSNTPVMLIEGFYADMCLFETAVLGVLRHATSIATKASRVKKLARDRRVVFFGLRALHPAIAPSVDRAAYIGGVDAVSGDFSRRYLGVTPVGTMPHALIVVFEDNVAAWKAFDEVIEPEVPRIMLVDTFNDERVETLQAIEALGSRLYGVRLDTPRSRRGSMREIVEEIRWTLKALNYPEIKIVVSGGVGEKSIVELRDIVDMFGVGTSIAFPPPVDISMDIVEVDRGGRWVPIAKRGKMPGAKRVFKCDVLDYEVALWSEEPARCSEDILVKWLENGRLVRDYPNSSEIRSYVLSQLSRVPEPQAL